jgi:hypothetical protein
MALTLEERTRRVTALTVAETARRLNGAAHQDERAADPGASLLLAPPTGEGKGALPAASEDRRLAPPVVTITISGGPRSGKSVVAHLIRVALGRDGIACNGPAGLRSLDRRAATAGLIGRGLTVELVKTEAGAEGAR